MNLLIALAAVAKRRILFHVVVDSPHRAIVGARVDDLHERIDLADRADDARVETVERALGERHAVLAAHRGVPELAVSAHERVEAALGSPDAIAARMDVHEEPQDSRAVGRAVRAGVDVHELVARARLEVAALLLDRAEARRSERPTRHEIRCRAPQEGFDALAVRAQDPLDALL